jgi:hypothetical protein
MEGQFLPKKVQKMHFFSFFCAFLVDLILKPPWGGEVLVKLAIIT